MSLESLLFDNPVLVKHVRSRLRPQHIYPSIALVVIVAALIMWAAVRLDGVRNGVAFTIFTSLQGLILFLGGTSQVATAVSQARESGTLDFHRVSPVSPLAVTLGFLLGGPIREWVLAATLLPFQLACVGWNTPGPLGLVETLVVVITSALLYHAIGVLAGVAVKSRSVSGAVVFVVIAFHIFGLLRLTIVPTVAEVIGQARDLNLSTAFYGVHMSHFLLTLIHQVPVFLFVFIAARRKMRHERAFPFAKPTAVVFDLVIAFYLLGNVSNWWGLTQAMPADAIPVLVLYVMSFAGVVLTTAVTPGWGDFANGVRRARKGGHARPGAWTDLAANWAPLVAFSLVVIVAGVLGNVITGRSAVELGDVLKGGLVGALAVFTFGSALQTFDLSFRRAGQGYFALFLFVAWLVPLLVGFVAGITEAPEKVIATVLSLSPVAGVAIAGVHDIHSEFPVPAGLAIGAGVVVAAVFLLLRVRAERKAEAVG